MVFRVNKTKDYTVMSNHHLKDKQLTLKAKGLLSLMLSLPDDWDYSINGLVAICKENGSAIRSALAELEKGGYLKRTETHDAATGKFDYIYDIFETAESPYIENPHTVNPHTDKPRTENPHIENHTQLNTKVSTTKEANTKGVSTKTHKSAFDTLIDEYTDDPELREALREYGESRKQLKKPLNEHSLALSLKKLTGLSTDTRTRIAIVNQSIERGWIGLFEIDRGRNNGRNAQYRGNPATDDRPIAVGKWDTVI